MKASFSAILAVLTAAPALAQSADTPVRASRIVVAQAVQAPVSGSGVVKKVDPAKKTVNLEHQAIPAIRWPAMTMNFQVDSSVDLNKLQPGQAVEFTLAKNAKGTYTITGIKPTP